MSSRIDSHLQIGSRNRGYVASGTDQPVCDTPFKDGHIQFGAGGAHQAHGARFLDRLHDHDRSGRIDQDFEALEGIRHMGLIRLVWLHWFDQSQLATVK